LDLPYSTRDTGIGLGLALSSVGDGDMQISVMQSFGARIADDAGKTAAIKSDATKAYLTRVKNAWGQGPLPPWQHDVGRCRRQH
jgi:multiple sugar transport system substrate-binding protein